MRPFSNHEDKARYNKPLYGLAGKYTLSEGIALPYFLSLLEINRAIDELKIAEQIPASLDTQWSLKELFQREIDEKRVEDDIVKGYLLDPKKLKFFNAITIVLMPKGDDGKIQDNKLYSAMNLYLDLFKIGFTQIKLFILLLNL